MKIPKAFSPLLVLVCGPSGSGKTTLVNALIADKTLGDFMRGLTCTTRSSRRGEVQMKDYCFLSEEVFEEMKAKNMLFATEELYGAKYGIEKLTKNMFCFGFLTGLIYILGPEGVRAFKEEFPSAISIFIKPSSPEEVAERIRERNLPSTETAQRIQRGKERLALANEFDYVLENKDFAECFAAFFKIIADVLREKHLQEV